MKSLRFILKQYPLTLILYFQELLLFLFVFVPLRAWFIGLAGNNYYARHFTIDFIPEMLSGNGSGGTPFFVLVIILLVLFFFIRILLMAGVFESLLSHYPGFRRFLFDCGAHGRRFVFLFVIYGIPMLILAGLIPRGLAALTATSPDQLMPVYTLAAGRVLVILLSIFVSYLHTAARYRTVLENRVRLAFAIRGGLFIRFFGYQLSSVIFGLLLVWGGFLLVLQTGTLMTVAGFLVFQLALLTRIALKLASYKVLS